MSLCPVILAGGGGTRLWPLSREYYPKQFLSLFSEYSLLQETLQRLSGLEQKLELLQPLIVCNEEHRFLVLEQTARTGHGLQQILLEPVGRNTAPALTVSAIYLLQQGKDPVLVMMPADHQITHIAKFQTTVISGYRLALKDYLITFGITPKTAETGYGYIQCGKEFSHETADKCFRIMAFKEKPAQHTAESYLAAGTYLWNSGIFMMKASIWCKYVQQFHPDMYAACSRACSEGTQDERFFHLNKEAFTACRPDSIDYAVMEPLAREQDSMAAVIPLDAGWSDVGAWSAVWALGQPDRNNNVTSGDVIAHESTNNLIRSGHRLVATMGCDNMVIVETADSVLVASMDKSQEIKKITGMLESGQRQERLTHRRVYRPWGSYETVDFGENFQVKRLTIQPGKKISLQSHTQRAEHWVVVKGTAWVTRADEVFTLRKNESTYIPAGTRHRLENPADELLEIIEVQSGDYLGEDDIVRYADDFGRS